MQDMDELETLKELKNKSITICYNDIYFRTRRYYERSDIIRAKGFIIKPFKEDVIVESLSRL